MHTILIVIHLLIVLALVGIVLVQKSEGGGLGIGGGSGFMTARGAANTLTRTTGILAAAFFATSLALGILARYGSGPTDILNRIPVNQTTPGKTGGSLLDKLNESSPKSSSGTTGDSSGKAGTSQAGGATQQPPSGSESKAPATSSPAAGSDSKAASPATPAQEGGNGQAGSGSQIPTGQ